MAFVNNLRDNRAAIRLMRARILSTNLTSLIFLLRRPRVARAFATEAPVARPSMCVPIVIGII